LTKEISNNINEKVGIKPGAIYSYFESKDDIIRLALGKEIYKGVF